MKQYKLIKEYPNSNKLGFETKQLSGSPNYADYPEFWQEIIEKDYEILSFIRNHGTAKGAIKIKVKNSKDLFIWNLTLRVDTEERILKSNEFNIHSIKRLSDGEIFTVGDETYKGKITKFEIDDNNLICFIENVMWIKLELLKKSKQPLFTTEDGIDIFEGDVYCYIKEDFLNSNIWVGTAKTSVKDTFITFSTKEKAEEYIILNKPCLSIMDIIEYNGIKDRGFGMPSLTREQFKELVKLKL